MKVTGEFPAQINWLIFVTFLINKQYLIEAVSKCAKLSRPEKERLERSLAVEVIIAIAYNSNCLNPERVAVTHITTIVAAMRNPEIYSQKKEESIADRLEMGNHYPGGNPHIVRAGMILLEILSLNNHYAGLESDKISGKYNPLDNYSPDNHQKSIVYKEDFSMLMNDYLQLPHQAQKAFDFIFDRVIKGSFWA